MRGVTLTSTPKCTFTLMVRTSLAHSSSVSVTSGGDMLRSKVFMYHIDTNKTFTAIIAGSGFTLWYTKEKENKK